MVVAEVGEASATVSCTVGAEEAIAQGAAKVVMVQGEAAASAEAKAAVSCRPGQYRAKACTPDHSHQ